VALGCRDSVTMRVVLAVAVISVAGCTPLWDYSPRTALEEEADYVRTLASYKKLASERVSTLTITGGLVAPTISPLRKAHTVAFADWMACIQGQGEGQRRMFAIFYRDRKVADLRTAVVIDGCDLESFEKL